MKSISPKMTRLFTEFIRSEQASGVILMACTVISIVIANSTLGKAFLDFWQLKMGFDIGGLQLKFSLGYLINDGLMAVFFLLIGLEIERELYIGELSKLKHVALPVFAAAGGIAMPVLIHFLFNRGTESQGGAAIPMSTDIAFALGVVALLGNKVPVAIKIFLTALAIIDDLAAIIIIAFFYVGNFSLLYLILALGIFAGLLALNRMGSRRLPLYLIPGLVMWYFMLKSGVHPDLTGVLLAFAIPFGQGERESPSYRLQHFLNMPVAFIIMPLFALANTAIILKGNWIEGLATLNSIGIIAGLFIGKPLGVVLFSLAAIKFRLAKFHKGVFWRHIIGVGFLSGIGFTMSIFITLLAFDNPEVVQNSKIAVMLSSLLAGTTGYLILNKQRSDTAI
ncbi:Na(+)/H(+) antiporter NhaA [uncultured Desulfobacterium sp.]|uniref:Na(+)/H(+) antiporter NhaA n=1 Tax=uncultured Desulfobacterium sp. TaxID=201089 RepID=A0A445MSS8_9BACT|nr:Na(+)/H(+) antiporter NhaA [uncultured Desulfobacterium sp.]